MSVLLRSPGAYTDEFQSNVSTARRFEDSRLKTSFTEQHPGTDFFVLASLRTSFW